VHEFLFNIARGLILGEVRFKERVEVLQGFIGEDVEAGGQAVLAGVLGGPGLALRRGGSFDFAPLRGMRWIEMPWLGIAWRAGWDLGRAWGRS